MFFCIARYSGVEEYFEYLNIILFSNVFNVKSIVFLNDSEHVFILRNFLIDDKLLHRHRHRHRRVVILDDDHF